MAESPGEAGQNVEEHEPLRVPGYDGLIHLSSRDVGDVVPNAYSKYPLSYLVSAAYNGDLPLLEKLLDREDPVNGYHHDLNQHHGEMNALHAAASNGHVEAVEMLLKAGADPHVKAHVAKGKNPVDGKTARAMAEEWGWDDIVAELKKAEEKTPKGYYMKYGEFNNMKLYPIDQPEGLDLEQEKRCKAKHKGMLAPLPTKKERKFYGDLVYGITHGYDDKGSAIVEGSRRRKIKGMGGGQARTKIGLLFPGQGSQYVKMMENIPESAKVTEYCDIANRVLGYDLLQICREGPEAKLEDMEVAQPAIFLASIVALEALREQRPEAAESPGAVAGLSLGELSALTAAGVFDFETGLKLVKLRSEAMAEASKSPPQAMLSVAGIDKVQLDTCCKQAHDKTGGVCQIANCLFPRGFTCAGSKAAIEELKGLVDSAGALQSKVLANNGAFHTELMRPARERLEKALREALPKMNPPRCHVYMNSTGEKVKAGTSPDVIIPMLADQLTTVVLWEDSCKNMIAAGLEECYEVGPMKQLKAMMKRIDPEMWNKTQNIGV